MTGVGRQPRTARPASERRRPDFMEITGVDRILPSAPYLCRSCFLRLWLNRRFNHVQSAFGLGQTRPAPRARIFPVDHSPGAMSAADAGVILIVQRVVGDIVVVNVAPDLF